MKKKIVVILGPTGAGKSALGVLLAKKFNGEIISADSRQVYKGLNIGTAKITEEEMQGVAHHLLDVADPMESFTAADYKKLAEKVILEINERGKIPFLVGGSGFYIDAVLYDMSFPPVSPNTNLRKVLEEKSAEELFKELQTKDPKRASAIDPHNKKRLIRALEIIDSIGKVPNLEKKSKNQSLIIGTAVKDWDAHDKWLLERLDKRLESGLIEEVKNLHDHEGVGWKRLYDLGLEYRWVAEYLQGKVEYETMCERLWIDIRKYARRQMTWFKRDKDIYWVNSPAEAEKIVQDYMI